MKLRHFITPFIAVGILLMANCAKKGAPSGGNLDTIPPVIEKMYPENYTINFTEKEIRIQFDEYIKLKDLQKNLIISPPMEYAPIITPTSTSKQLKIKIVDTLKENTTYSINFGRSIVDNNEENEFDYFKYVFSTGTFIDSLKVNGRVGDALLPVAEFPVTVMLYEVNERFDDSLIYSEKPTYITTTRDSTNTFEITNVKEGKYLLMALKEENNDFTFQPETDKIGFQKEFIDLPTDSTYSLTIFNEELDYEPSRPSQRSKYSIVFGYQGDGSKMTLDPISGLPDDFNSRSIRAIDTDSLYLWYTPEIKTDSVYFLAKNGMREDTLLVRTKSLYADSLRITPHVTGTLTPKDTVQLLGNTPIVSIDAEKISVMDKDSLFLAVTTSLDSSFNLASIIFEKTEEQRYKVNLLPGAITDFYQAVNDTLEYTIQTKSTSDYGTLDLTLTNLNRYPVIVQLVNDRFAISKELYVKEGEPIYFDYINPGVYYIRIIYDENNNGKWDPGDFKERIQPEEVIFYPSKLEVRANWSLKETFNLN